MSILFGEKNNILTDVMIANEVKMKILEKNEKTPNLFCIKLMQNHVEMCFKSYFFRGCRQHMCSVYLECTYWQPNQPTEELREKFIFHYFLIKK